MTEPDLNMSPRPADGDFPDDSRGDAVRARDRTAGVPCGDPFANPKNLPLIQERIGMLAAALQQLGVEARAVFITALEAFRVRSRAVTIPTLRIVSAFRDAISSVPLVCAKEQMRRIAAGRRVATMQHQPAGLAVSPGPISRKLDLVVKRVRHAVGLFQRSLITDVAIPSGVEREFPRPAVVRATNIDVRPKLRGCVPVPGDSCHA